MAVLAIPSPKKTTQVDFPIERVKLSVLNINLINDKYKFTTSNEIFNQYTYEALEFLSLGVYIDINLNRLSEDKTEISVEIRRKLGTFNQSHEVTKANEHLVKIFDCIAKLTAKSEEEIENIKQQRVMKNGNTSNSTSKHREISNAWYEKNWLVILLCVLFFPVGLYALWKNSSIAKGWKIAITVIISLIILTNLGDEKIKTNSSNASTVSSEKESIAETEVKKTESKPDVEILKQTATYQDVMNAYTIHCRVRNNTSELISYVDLKATFYDKKGNIVGTGIGNAANFAAGAEKTIDVMGVDIQNCDNYEVQVNNILN
ncbi:FxLYD domain-containing protein [Flavobacterium sp. H122]|uniref:FxLYD domain-containing protein n=1 Tax=Flavobacterium sp. H122 TaxID=2529860 RepID=UPI001B7D800E|nr:FxLYD domain-containing protein [Flavobacterium sp. H122]